MNTRTRDETRTIQRRDANVSTETPATTVGCRARSLSVAVGICPPRRPTVRAMMLRLLTVLIRAPTSQLRDTRHVLSATRLCAVALSFPCCHHNDDNDDDNKCVSRLASRKSHHTALSNAAATNSDCPPSVAAGARVGMGNVAAGNGSSPT